jgi:ATP-dependent DNA helicase PIF1
MSTASDYEYLSTRINTMTTDAMRFKQSVHLMHSNEEVNKFNLEKLSELTQNNQRICRITAYHNSAQAKSIAADQILGLEPEILLARGARVMLTSNEWTETGLTNGATGTLRYLIFEESGGPPNLPIAAVVEMDSFYTGPHLENKPRHVVIAPKTCSTSDGSNTLERTQLPLKLAFAITIHKSQGMTLNSARVKLGKRESPVGLTFVAFSRVRRLEDLLIDYENFESASRITKIHLPQYIKDFDVETNAIYENTMRFIREKNLITTEV